VSPVALAEGDWQAMFYVYIIRSISQPSQRYIGITNDVDARLKKHNAGGSPHTAKFMPWALETVVGFSEEKKAHAFERYMKSGSGFAFSKKHF